MGRVIVIGSINMDVVAQTSRLPRPGETLIGHALNTIPGGKGANQAVAACRSGAEVQMVGALGSDNFAPTLLEFLNSEGIATGAVTRREGSSGTALIVVEESGENMIVIVPGANDAVRPNTLGDLGLAAADVVLLQDEVPEETNVEVVRQVKETGARCVLNLAPYRGSDPTLLASVDYLVVNETEFALLLNDDKSIMSASRVAGLLAEGAGPHVDIVVTLGADGLVSRLNGQVVRTEGHTVTAVDTTGAGDCFCGSFGAALAGGSTANTALEFANAAAALSVTTLGAGPSMPTREETDSFLSSSS